MNKEELREKRNRTIETLDDIKAVLGLDELYIDELEKENAELKSDNDARKFAMAMSEKVEKKFREENAKAKELLNEFMRISKASDEDFEHDYSELVAEAEQFLSEVEK